ncbi:MAG: NnrS family protein [Myxococcota bacterium]
MTLFARGFRPFFLLAALQACFSVLFWLAIFAGLAPAPAWLSPSLWHAHEMIFGFVAAAAAGFLLTAAPTWTQSRAPSGAPLAALACLWLAGRIAMAFAGALPLALVALLDVAFLPALAFAVGRPIVAARQTRNYGFPAVLSALALANIAAHLDALGLVSGLASLCLHAGVDLAIVLIVVVGGRITPSFTANAFRRDGIAALVRTRPWIDRVAIAAVLGVALANLLAPRTPASGALALVAGLAVAARMSGWQTRHALRDPLVFSLHLGYAWVAIGLFAVALADLGGVIPWSVGLHAETTGAIGTMVLAVMTRVALGHTGRPLVAPRAASAAYLLVSAAAITRTLGALGSSDSYLHVIALTALLWASGFAAFLLHYAPILVRPRSDGAPG